MRGCDVRHVERRILPKPYHIGCGKIFPECLALGEMVRFDLPDRQVASFGQQTPVLKNQVFRKIVEQAVAALLRLANYPKRAVGVDIY